MNSIQNPGSTYAQSVQATTAQAIGNEESLPVYTLLQVVLAKAQKINEEGLRTKLTAYKAKLDMQKQYNDSYASMQGYMAGYKDTNAATTRTSTAGGVSDSSAKNIKSLMDMKEQWAKDGQQVSYSKMVENGISAKYFKDDEIATMKQRAAIADEMAKLGIDPAKIKDYMNGTISRGDAEGLITKLKSASEAIGSELQLEMLDIQSLKSKIDQIIQALSSTIKSQGDIGQSIANKL